MTQTFGPAELALQSISAAPTSLYARIRDELRAQIVSAFYAPHARLPSIVVFFRGAIYWKLPMHSISHRSAYQYC